MSGNLTKIQDGTSHLVSERKYSRLQKPGPHLWAESEEEEATCSQSSKSPELEPLQRQTLSTSLPRLNPGHLTLRDSKTNILFLHYVAETVTPLCTRSENDNPFVTCVLPRAYSDSLIMSAVIALSGVHFCHKNPNAEMLYVTWQYYAQAVRGLKYELTRLDGDEQSLVRLLFVTILLCHVEVNFLALPHTPGRHDT